MSMARDLFNNLSAAPSIAAVESDETVTGDGVDLRGFHSALVAINVGESGATINGDNTISFTLEESDDDESYTAVAAGDVQGTLPVIDAAGKLEAVYKLGYQGSKRFILAKATYAGTHAGETGIAAVVLRGHATYNPAA